MRPRYASSMRTEWLTTGRNGTLSKISSRSWHVCAIPCLAVPGMWQQTFATIAPYTIEEAYEVAGAIAREDLDALKDELGDLLLQVVYHARMASEQNRFEFADVVDAITRKMIRLH